MKSSIQHTRPAKANSDHIFFVAVTFLILSGCTSPKVLEKPKPSEETAMEEYERTFRPSDYDMDLKVFLPDLKKETEVNAVPGDPVVVEPSVIVPGYRVQLFATPEIDDANARKIEAEAAFPGQWFYLEYDPPTYKLRAGNFLNRNDADSYAKYLAENGFPDAWIVPERVMKNLPPRVPPPQEQSPPKQ